VYDVANPELTPEQQQQYQLLNTQYRNLFGSGNFGDFDYNAYLNDPRYSQTIWGTASQGGNQAQKQQALTALTNFFSGVGPGAVGGDKGFTPIDPKPFFDPLRGDIDKYAGQSLMNQNAQINQARTNATNQATEAFAGTGLGRSGVAAQTFQGIAERGASEMEEASRGIEQARTAAQLALSMKEAEFSISEQLSGRQWNQEQIMSAIGFQRSLWGMQFQSDIRESEEDWTDTWGPVIGAALGAAGSFVPTGGGGSTTNYY